MTPTEEEGPMVQHRSVFESARAVHWYEDGVLHVTHDASALPFAGGDVPLPKPTRAELILSAQQWSKALRDHAVDWNSHNDMARGMFDRLDAVLAELAAQ